MPKKSDIMVRIVNKKIRNDNRSIAEIARLADVSKSFVGFIKHGERSVGGESLCKFMRLYGMLSFEEPE